MHVEEERSKMKEAEPLILCHVDKKSIILNGALTLIQFIALSLLIYYRFSTLFQSQIPNIPLTLVAISELNLTFVWLLSAQFGWRPVFREVFPERLPEDSKLPAVDVFICTADPNKEPTLEVMNTVISAISLDYPADKLNVYLSDDAGSVVTLNALKEAWKFCKTWLPFCRRFGLKCRCPEVYFTGGDEDIYDDDFVAEKSKVKEEYEMFSKRVMKIRGSETIRVTKDHSAIVEIIDDNSAKTEMPLLVYTAREKKHSSLHHFKAGALNVLMRVSGVLSNSPYILVLDCDMYSTDASSTRQAMCFNLDPNLSSSLAFVQFPQKFHMISKNDIYDIQFRSIFTVVCPGMDGFRGPPMLGTNFYIKREALYRTSMKDGGLNLEEIKHNFGTSNMFLNSLKPNDYNSNSELVLKESHILASCTYENSTTWGKEVGFRYSVVEDYFTGFNVHCNGWKSVYYSPQNPAFLGTMPTSLNGLLVQGSRWVAGFAAVAVSKFSPLLYGSSRMYRSKHVLFFFSL
jgi:cellulose synthase/poly-beta-1,6-N-acetylglucosamine synthase-like glycosyltransferase